MAFNLDFKVTTWERVTIDEKHKEMIEKAIKNGEIKNSNDVFSLLSSEEFEDDLECMKLDETEEQITVEQNKGFATIEIVENGKTTWKNGK